MTRAQAEERMRLAVVSGVIDIDDVVMELYVRRQYNNKEPPALYTEVSHEFIVDVLNTLLGENNVATPPFI